MFGEPQVAIACTYDRRRTAFRRWQGNVSGSPVQAKPAETISGRVGKPNRVVGPGGEPVCQGPASEIKGRNLCGRRDSPDLGFTQFAEPEITVRAGCNRKRSQGLQLLRRRWGGCRMQNRMRQWRQNVC